MIRDRLSGVEKTGPAQKTPAGRQAVVDIGSNSVRLVIYEGPRRAPMPICNEKALCGLGREPLADGSLNPAAVDYALATLRRFRSLLDEHGNPPTRVIATAAVREAKDGAEFAARIRELGFTPEIIGGAKEAELAALGVISCEPSASGLVGDMGGGSLELIEVRDGAVYEGASLSVGPLRLMQACAGRIADAPKAIDAGLAHAPWPSGARFNTLYSVGGAWRALARIHMRIRKYPLSVLHHYEFSRADAIDVCDLVAKQSRRSLLEIPGIPHRRLDTLPYAASVFKAVLLRFGIEQVIVSAGGVREGLLYEELSKEERKLDPLFEGARFFADRLSPTPEIGAAVSALTDDLFEDETPATRRIRVAACILSDIGAYFHPDLRAMQAFEMALHAPFCAISHRERIAIAIALHCRHDGKPPVSEGDHILALLPPEEKQWALRLGLALRFAGALAPKAPHALAGASLSARAGKLIFRAPNDRLALMGEMPRKRLAALANAFGFEPVEDYY